MIDQDLLSRVTDERFRQVCAGAIEDMNRLPIPGAVVGVCAGDQEFVAAFGVTSQEHPLDVTPGTLFQIGSITKTFVATAIMRLVERGRLDLDRPVRAYLPGLRLADEQVAASVSLRHLLTHTGGWVGDYFNDFGAGDDALERAVGQLADLPQLNPLGSTYSYNNAGFYLAGRVLEAAAGQSFERAIQDLIFTPLGMTHSYFFAEDVITHRFAVGHEVIDRQPQVARPWAIGRASHPVGGIVCSLPDLFRYARFHMGDGTALGDQRLLSVQSLEAMHSPAFPSTGLNWIGLTWNITPVGEDRLIGHGGATKGQNTLLRIVPSQQFAVAAFTNSDEGGILCDHIAELATRQFLGLELPAAVPLELAGEDLLPYVARYDGAGELYDLALGETGLVLHEKPKGHFPTPSSPPSQPLPPLRAALYGPDRMVVLDEPMKGARGEFLRAPDGRIEWLRLSGRIHARLS